MRASAVDDQVGGGVVAHRDHQRGQVAPGQLKPGHERLQHPVPSTDVPAGTSVRSSGSSRSAGSAARRGGVAGIRALAQLEVLDWPAYIKRQRASDYTSTNTNFFPKVDPDDAYYRYFHSKGGANELSGGYANPAADKLLEEGESTVDAAKRAEVYRRAWS
jgi:hypothetical protein